MSAELQDFRAKITSETHCALEAVSRSSGRDRSEIAREILHKWALEQIHGATVLHKLLQAEGLSGIAEGVSGNLRESQGVRGRAGE